MHGSLISNLLHFMHDLGKKKNMCIDFGVILKVSLVFFLSPSKNDVAIKITI
jgi:hypothetical protein